MTPRSSSDAPPLMPQPAAGAWARIRELHERLVALESELELLQQRSPCAWRACAGRASQQARDLAGRGEWRLPVAVAARLPRRIKAPLRALQRFALRSRPSRTEPSPVTIFPDSAVAHRYLDGLVGIEIGASAHNPFHIAGCLTVDYTDEPTVFTAEQVRLSGEATRVDVIAPGDDLPFPDASLDYVLSSHVLEHFYDPVGALREWSRVVRPGGYIFVIIPHRDRTFDRERPLTSVEELQGRHAARRAAAARGEPTSERDAHRSVWTTQTFLDLCEDLGLRVAHVDDVDDKVGNGFTVVIRR